MPAPTASTHTVAPPAPNSDTVSTSDQGNGTIQADKLFSWFFLGLLFFALALLYILLQPFLHSLILACVFTAIAYPMYQRCLRLTKGRPALSAAIVLCLLLFLVVVPICIFVAGLIPQAAKSIAAVNNWLAGAHLSEVLNGHITPVLAWVQEQFPDFDIASLDIHSSILGVSRNIGSMLLSTGTYLLGNTLLFFAHLLLIMLIMFFLLIEGPALVHRLAYLLPLKQAQTRVVIESLRRVSRAVLIGSFLVALLQGLAGGIGFALVGIPALFWGTVMAFAALVPVVGTGLVWLPAVGYLFIAGRWESALFLTLWCGIGVTSIDSVLRPLLMRKGAKVSVLFIFLSILGGVNVFGMLGLLYGPMILCFVSVMLLIYAEEYECALQTRDDNARPGA